MLHFFSGEVLYPKHVNFYEAEIIFQDLFCRHASLPTDFYKQIN